MNRDQVERLLVQARRITNHSDYVIIGSLSALGVSATAPAEMTGSVDVDLYPRDDPGRAGEVFKELGQGSEFEQRFGFYADPVSPNLATLPDDWESRLVPVHFESGVTAWFLEANDAAISKYVRGEARDRDWIRAGLAAGVLSLAAIRWRLHDTVMESDERQRARQALAEDMALFDPDHDEDAEST